MIELRDKNNDGKTECENGKWLTNVLNVLNMHSESHSNTLITCFLCT